MRWVQLESPEGPFYVDLAHVSAIGPSIRDKDLTGAIVNLRLLYLAGGQGIAIFDSAENMSTLFETSKGRLS